MRNDQGGNSDSGMELADVDKNVNHYENALKLLATDPTLQKEVLK